MAAALRVAALCAVVLARVLPAQQFDHSYDHVLNDQGQSRFTLATGIPYLAIGEYAYGVSDRVTLGVLAGVTPTVEGYGIRARAVLYQPSLRFRVYFCTPVFFYPNSHIDGHGSWWLTRPNINFEWMTPGGLRYKVGGSAIAVVSQRTLMGAASDPVRFWNAVHGGISFPMGPRATFQLESSLVMKGTRVAGSDWVGGPPVILVLGTSWALGRVRNRRS